MNYSASEVGVPYCRVPRITINYPDNNQPPSLTIEQSMAVRLQDGTVRKLEDLPVVSTIIDFSKATAPIPLVDLETGAYLGSITTLQEVFMKVLAFVRNVQVTNEP